MVEINGYDLSRNWFDWCFENPDKITPTHTAIYFFAIEHCNRLGWKSKFGFPTQMAMDALGIKNWRTFSKAFNEIVEFGFIEVVEKSRNQYSANVIAIVKNTKANTKAYTKATQKHIQKQSSSTYSSTAHIDKPITIEPNNQLTNKQYYSFDEFWEAYGKKVDYKKAKQKYLLLTTPEKIEIFKTLADYIKSTPDIKFRKHASTYINNKSWENDYTSKSEQQTIADIGRQQLFAIFGNT